MLTSRSWRWLLFFALTPSVWAQRGAGPRSHEAWTTENGLPQNSVHAVMQTGDGYVWVATEGGLARFNGVGFTVFRKENTPAFTSDDLCCLAEDKAGVLWVGGSDGLLRYEGGRFVRFAGIPAGGVTMLEAEPDGALLVKTAERLVRLVHGTVSQAASEGPMPPDAVERMGRLADGSTWELTPSSVMVSWNALRAGKELPAGRVQAFLGDSGGGLWVGMDHGLYSLTSGKVAALGDASVLSIFEDREHDVWVGTDTGGLHVLRPQAFQTVPALLGHALTAVTQTSDGAMWAGSRGEGLFRYNHGETRQWTTQKGLVSDVILALAADRDGSLWVGTPDGLNHLRGGMVEAYRSADGLPDDLVRSLFADVDGSLWVGTRRGLAHRVDGRFVVLSQADGLPSDLVGAMLRTSTQDLWVGTLGGLVRLRDGKVTVFTHRDGLDGDVVTALAQGVDQTLWVGTKDGGLSRSAGAGFAAVGRMHGAVGDVLSDGRGGLWLTGERGVARVAETDALACGAGRECEFPVMRYGVSDGMPSDEVSTQGHPAAWRAANGELWFATRKGVAVVDPAGLPEGAAPPPVAVETFSVDDVERPVGEAESVVEPGHRRYGFAYVGLSYAAPSRLRYRYMLAGFDAGWMEAGTRRSAYYTNLGPGRYRFRVQAAGADGVWGAAAELGFVVRAPVYRTWWFVSLMVLLLAGLVWLAYRVRVRVLRGRFDAILAERSRIAREIHDTLAQGFAGVSLQLELTAHLLAQAKVEEASRQVDETRSLVREGLADARHSIWELRSGTSDAGLPERLQQMMVRVLGAEIEGEFTVSGTYRALSPELEHEVLRIEQEAMVNAARHSAAAHVRVRLRYATEELEMVVSDDGVGFVQGAGGAGHFGLMGMAERAKSVGGELAIESSREGGTAVRLRVPLGRG